MHALCLDHLVLRLISAYFGPRGHFSRADIADGPTIAKLARQSKEFYLHACSCVLGEVEDVDLSVGQDDPHADRRVAQRVDGVVRARERVALDPGSLGWTPWGGKKGAWVEGDYHETGIP
jgi:hypothetical protein